MTSKLDGERFDLIVKLRSLSVAIASATNQRQRSHLDGQMQRVIDDVDAYIKRLLNDDATD